MAKRIVSRVSIVRSIVSIVIELEVELNCVSVREAAKFVILLLVNLLI